MTKPNSEKPRFRRGDIFEVRPPHNSIYSPVWAGLVGVIDRESGHGVYFKTIYSPNTTTDGAKYFSYGSLVHGWTVVIGHVNET